MTDDQCTKYEKIEVIWQLNKTVKGAGVHLACVYSFSEVPFITMNAFQPSRLPVQPPQQRRVTPRRKRHLRQRSYQVMALESTAKIAVNVVISTAAVSALMQLLPYHWSQQEKLRTIRIDVNQMEERVYQLQGEFSRNFDPRQAKMIMQEQGYRFDPNQRQVVFPKDTIEHKQLESN